METALNKQPYHLWLQRDFLCRIVFAFIFIDLLYNFFSNSMVHQLQTPSLKFPYIDITYWLFHLLKIPDTVSSNQLLAYCLGFFLFIFSIGTLLFPSRRIFIKAFFVFYVIYYIIFNSYGTHHTHSKIGILLMPIPFFLKSNKRFEFMWEAMRYFTLFIYADAFFWKLTRFTFLSPDQGILILKKNLAAYLYFNPQTSLAGMYTWLLDHPSFCHLLFILGFLSEGFFIIGFFTKRFDRFLFALSILLPVGFLLMSDAFFFELIVFSITLISFRRLQFPEAR